MVFVVGLCGWMIVLLFLDGLFVGGFDVVLMLLLGLVIRCFVC